MPINHPNERIKKNMSYYDDLPKPRRLKRGILLDYDYGKEKIRFLLAGCNLITIQNDDFPDPVECLHGYGGKLPTPDELIAGAPNKIKAVNLFLPIQHVTYITLGADITLIASGKDPDNILVAPSKDKPDNRMDPQVIRATLNELSDYSDD